MEEWEILLKYYIVLTNFYGDISPIAVGLIPCSMGWSWRAGDDDIISCGI